MGSQAGSRIDDMSSPVEDDEHLQTVLDDSGYHWLEEELLDCGVPEFGLDQWLLHFLKEAVASAAEMPDGKLLNFFCLMRDRALNEEPTFVELLEQVEALIYGRMPDAGTRDGDEEELLGYEPDQCTDALKDVCAGTLPDRHLVELFDLAATLRAEPKVGHMWAAVMYLSRAQILLRMKRARLRPPADRIEPQEDDLGTGDLPPPPSTARLVTDAETCSTPSRSDQPFVALPLIPWMTHAYEVAELAFREDMPDGQLLDLVQLADWMRNYEHNGLNSAEWNAMRREAANLIMRRLVGEDCPPLSDKWPHDTRSWRLNEFRDAEHRIPTLDAATLVHLYVQTGENSYLCAREPLQGHWEVVGARCRTEILRRFSAAASGPKQEFTDVSPSENFDDLDIEDDEEDVEKDEQGVEFVSMREALRVAEESFRPDISDAQLLELYVLVEEHSNPDEDVFDEIGEPISKMILDRLRRHSPNPDFERYEPSFDYPDEGKQALEAVLKGQLPHKNLLMLYRLCWDRDRADPTWLAVHDLCRGQLLERMKRSSGRNGRDWRDWKILQLTRRVQAYR